MGYDVIFTPPRRHTGTATDLFICSVVAAGYVAHSQDLSIKHRAADTARPQQDIIPLNIMSPDVTVDARVIIETLKICIHQQW